MKALNDQDVEKILSSGAGVNIEGSLLQKLAKHYPSELVAAITPVVFNSSNEPLFRAAVSQLSQSHPEAAMEILASLPSGESKNMLVSTYYGGLAGQDLQTTTEAISKLADPDERSAAYRGIGAAVSGKGMDEVIALSNSLGEADRTSLLDASLPSVLSQDPKGLSEALASGQLELPDSLADKVYSDLAYSFDNSNSSEAREWFTNLPPQTKPQAMKGLARSMMARDIMGYANMLNEMPKDSAWQEGVQILVENLRRSDPERATLWEAQLPPPAKKE